MADNSKKPSDAGENPSATASESSPVKETAGGGWGGWGFSPPSYISDLQKAAAVAAEEISRNAAEAARTAAKNISDTMAENSESSKEDGTESSAVEEESDDENDKRRKAALEKLEKASEDSFLSQGLTVIDSSVESLTSRAWQAFGTAWTGSAPSLLETGKAFTAKGMEVLELVGKETMDLLVPEPGTGVEKKTKGSNGITGDEQFFEEVTLTDVFTYMEVQSSWRSWRFCRIIIPYYITEGRLNSLLSKNLFMMESLKKSNKFSH